MKNVLNVARSPFWLLPLFLLAGCALLSKGPDLTRIEANRDATFRLDILPKGHGSGIVVSREGHILTAAHVALAGIGQPGAGIEIVIDDGDGKPKVYPAEVIAVDPDHDVALVKIDHRFDRPAGLADPDEVHPGDAVYNVGYPYDFGQMVGRGYVQKTHFNYADPDGGADIKDATLVDMPDGPGTSGSGIFLARNGKLMGIMSMAFWVSAGSQPPTITRVLVSVKYARALLEANGVKYSTNASPPGGAMTTDLIVRPAASVKR